MCCLAGNNWLVFCYSSPKHKLPGKSLLVLIRDFALVNLEDTWGKTGENVGENTYHFLSDENSYLFSLCFLRLSSNIVRLFCIYLGHTTFPNFSKIDCSPYIFINFCPSKPSYALLNSIQM